MYFCNKYYVLLQLLKGWCGSVFNEFSIGITKLHILEVLILYLHTIIDKILYILLEKSVISVILFEK